MSSFGGSSISREDPDLTLPSQLLHYLGDTEAFSAECCDLPNMSWVCPVCPGGTCLEHLTQEAFKRHPCQMPEPPQLARLDVEE